MQRLQDENGAQAPRDIPPDDDYDLNAARETAAYAAELLDSLEMLAHRSGLDILSAMLAMACEQARDDLEGLKRGYPPSG